MFTRLQLQLGKSHSYMVVLFMQAGQSSKITKFALINKFPTIHILLHQYLPVGCRQETPDPVDVHEARSNKQFS